jgi:heat shock protein HtpX
MQDDHYLYNTDFLKAIRKNKRNSAILLLCLFIILAGLGYLLGWFVELQTINYHSSSLYNYQYYNNVPRTVNLPVEISQLGMLFSLCALAIGILWASIAVFFGRRLMLFSVNAKEISPLDSEYSVLTNVVQEMSIAAGITPPKTYIVETDALNAFATGMRPNNAAIAITRGLLQQLNRDELQGVMAHEIGHVINYDIRYQTLVSIIVGLIIFLSDMAMRMVFHSTVHNSRHRRSNNNNNNNGNNAAIIVGLILIAFSIIAPIAALMLQMAVSRQREYMADATSVKLTRAPLGLISALEKLAENAKPFPGVSKANQNLFIVNPFKNVAKLKSSLFATHPAISDRIMRLKNLDK